MQDLMQTKADKTITQETYLPTIYRYNFPIKQERSSYFGITANTGPRLFQLISSLEY